MLVIRLNIHGYKIISSYKLFPVENLEGQMKHFHRVTIIRGLHTSHVFKKFILLYNIS